MMSSLPLFVGIDVAKDTLDVAVRPLKKQAEYERIIFIDVNVPPEGLTSLETKFLKKVEEQVGRLEKSQAANNPWPPAFNVFTNHPYHYVGNDQSGPEPAVVFSMINMPDLKQHDPVVSGKYPAIGQLIHSVINHTTIPRDFS
jgi:hypothetical protein